MMALTNVLRVTVIWLMVLCGRVCAGGSSSFYIAVVELDWDYAVAGDVLHAAGSSFQHKRTKYKKAVYRKFTNHTFSEEIPNDPEHGIIGPVLKANILETVIVHFKNLASRPFSIDIHGGLEHRSTHHQTNTYYAQNPKQRPNELLFREKNQGADHVAPGETRTYKWKISRSSGPNVDDDLCVPWLFHSGSNDLERDIHSGPVGVLLACDELRDISNKYSKQSERYTDRHIDKDLLVVLQTFDESKSWYAEENSVSADSKDDIFHSINGLTYGNLKIEACSGHLVRWWILALGDSQDVHSFHVHGHILNNCNHRSSSASVVAGSGTSARMVVQEPGEWLIRDSVNQHYTNGLQAILKVKHCGVDLQQIMKNYEKDSPAGNHIRFYIAAEEIQWNYAPTGQDNLQLKNSYYNQYIKQGELGTTYKKVVYKEYTDNTFTKEKQRSPSLEYLGLLGPVIKVHVHDNVTVVFKNKASRHYSMHPVGLKYTKQYEGFRYAHKESYDRESVAPGKTFTYQWSVPALWANRGGYGYEQQCITGQYHSAVDPVRDTHSGLVGPILICNHREAHKSGKSYLLFMTVFNEKLSWYTEDYYKNNGQKNDDSEENIKPNLMHSINGFIYSNMPDIRVCTNDNIELHVMTSGDIQNIHTVNVNGQSVSFEGSRVMGPSVIPGVFRTYSIKTPSPGKWLIESNTFGMTQNGMTAFMDVSLCDSSPQSTEQSFVRTYYIAAQEILWDYTPLQYDFIRDEVLWSNTSTGYQFVNTEGATIGSRYKKVVYREYTDATFIHQKPVTNTTVYLGIMGPVILAGVGDTIKVIFKNKASRSYSIHAIGMQYDKQSEGYGYGAGHPGSAVEPNGTYTYTWHVPRHFGPLNDYYCISKLYHSTVDPIKDLHSGLIGPLLICRSGEFDKNGKRTWPSNSNPELFRDFHLLFHVFDENLSWYFHENFQVSTHDENLTLYKSPEFKESNKFYSINGRIYGSLEGIITNTSTWTEFYLLSVDAAHSARFHTTGAALMMKFAGVDSNTDTIPLLPGTAVPVVLREDVAPGTWLIHSAMMDYNQRGMAAIWHVRHSDSMDEKGMPWWYWQISRTEKNLVLVGGSILILAIVLFVWYSYKRFRKIHGFDSQPTPV